MQTSILTHDKITQHYTKAIDALLSIGRAYYMLGRLTDAQHLLRTSLQMLEVKEARPEHKLKLLLLYSQVLVVEHLLTHGSSDLLFSTILHAQEIAEMTRNQESIADALSLLGQAYYFTTVVESLKSGSSPNSPRDQGKYERAFAYQQQALELREAMHDTRGFSESYFQIGILYERWQQYDQAQEYYARARQVADQYGHLFEKTEPTRHAAIDALRRGDLDQALTLALQALSLREEANFKPYLPLDHLLIRDIYLAKGDKVNAELHTRQASVLAEEMGLKTLVSSLPNIQDVIENEV